MTTPGITASARPSDVIQHEAVIHPATPQVAAGRFQSASDFDPA